MRKHLTRRRIETVVAAALAAGTAVIGLSTRADERHPGPRVLKLEKIGRFDEPVWLTQAPGVSSPLYVVERPGTIRAISDGTVQRRPFLDIRRRVKDTGEGGEQGLLSLAFPPDYAESRRFYVAYTDNRNALRVVELRDPPGGELRADARSARLVLRIPQPTTKHHGGLLLFGPDDLLWIGSGDGGPSGDPNRVGQDKRVLLGKILRIDPRKGPPRPVKAKPARGSAPAKGKGEKGKRGDREPKTRRSPYTVPKDNPLVGRPGRDEIYAYGLRNPWRFSFDRAEDRIAIGDVGDVRFEEIDILPVAKVRGANFGWSAYEGSAKLNGGVPYKRTVKPTYVYPHGRRCSVIGGYVVRDPRLSRIKGREIIGSYVFGDFCAGRIFAFRPRPDKVGKERKLRFELPGVTSFGEDRSGRIYVLTYNGPVYRLDAGRKPSRD